MRWVADSHPTALDGNNPKQDDLLNSIIVCGMWGYYP